MLVRQIVSWLNVAEASEDRVQVARDDLGVGAERRSGGLEVEEIVVAGVPVDPALLVDQEHVDREVTGPTRSRRAMRVDRGLEVRVRRSCPGSSANVRAMTSVQMSSVSLRLLLVAAPVAVRIGAEVLEVGARARPCRGCPAVAIEAGLPRGPQSAVVAQVARLPLHWLGIAQRGDGAALGVE